MRAIISQSRDAAYNLALEEYVFTKLTGEDFLILWVNAPGIVVGKFQNVFQEINVRQAQRLGLLVHRRLTGGGCVYHDEGNLNFSIITQWAMAEDSYTRFLEPVLGIINGCGVHACRSGICNLCVDGKKFSGNAQSIYRGRILHHGTLLFDTDLDMLRQVIRPDYERFRSKAMRSMPAAVGNLKDCPGFNVKDLNELKHRILDGMGCRAGDAYEFPPAQEREIESLAEKKYRTWEWNMAQSATFTYDSALPTADTGRGAAASSVKAAGLSAPDGRVRMSVRQGVIEEIFIECPKETLEACAAAASSLTGQALDYPKLHQRLEAFGRLGRWIENTIF